MGKNIQHRSAQFPATLIFVDKGSSTEQHSGRIRREQKERVRVKRERERERGRERETDVWEEREREGRLDSHMPQPSCLVGSIILYTTQDKNIHTYSQYVQIVYTTCTY